MHADDDGVVEAFSVMRSVGTAEDNLKVLVSKGFVVVLNEDLVSFITDWQEHNLIRADRKVDSIYKELLLRIVPEATLIAQKPRADTGKPTGRPLDGERTAQVRLGKVRKGKDTKAVQGTANPLINEVIKLFEEVDPKNKTYYGNTSQRKAADFLLSEYGFEEIKKRVSVLPKTNKLPYFPTITTPVQLRDKWVQLQDAANRKRNESLSGKNGLA